VGDMGDVGMLGAMSGDVDLGLKLQRLGAWGEG